MSIETRRVVFCITYDTAEDSDPAEWNWAELVGECWATGDDDNGNAIALTTFAAAREVSE